MSVVGDVGRPSASGGGTEREKHLSEKTNLSKTAFLAVIAFLLATNCSGPQDAEVGGARIPEPGLPSPSPGPAQGVDDLGLSTTNTASFIDVFDPAQAYAGYTLVFYRKRLPALIDMNGNVVHAWPSVRAMERLRLSPQGDLLVIGLDRVVREYDWHGGEKWEYALSDSKDFPHHDLIRLAHGNYLLSYRSHADGTDYLLEITPGKKVAWRWDSKEHLAEFEKEVRSKNDPTHINSIQEIPANRFYDGGDTRFKPGNILVSARELNTIFVIDKHNGEITWQYHQGLDSQHEAQMTERGYPNSGSIFIFNNNLRGVYQKRRSEVLAIDPANNDRVAWRFGPKLFFSSVGGVQQVLPNGNLLITSTRGGRVFEINRSGEVVWQWRPPGWFPMRARRYPYDYCTQFEKLPEHTERPVADRQPGPYISRELSMFKWLGPRVSVSGKKRQLLDKQTICKPLVVPPYATLKLSYGVNHSALSTAAAAESYTVKYHASLAQADSDGRTFLVKDTLANDGSPPWREQSFPLAEYAYQTVTLCLGLSVKGIPEDLVGAAAWEVPVIRAQNRTPVDQAEPDEETPEIKELFKQRLEALGYIE